MYFCEDLILEFQQKGSVTAYGPHAYQELEEVKRALQLKNTKTKEVSSGGVVLSG